MGAAGDPWGQVEHQGTGASCPADAVMKGLHQLLFMVVITFCVCLAP